MFRSSRHLWPRRDVVVTNLVVTNHAVTELGGVDVLFTSLTIDHMRTALMPDAS